MNVSDVMSGNIASLRSAINMAVLKKSVNQDALSVDSLLRGMQETTNKIMESSVNPYKGQILDITI